VLRLWQVTQAVLTVCLPAPSGNALWPDEGIAKQSEAATMVIVVLVVAASQNRLGTVTAYKALSPI
jgi:hypothetical protein